MLNHFVIDSHPFELIVIESFIWSCAAVGAILSATDSVCTLQVHLTVSVLYKFYTWKLICAINAWYFSIVKGSQSRWNALTLQYCIRWGSGEWCHLYCAFQCSPITWLQQHRYSYSIKIVGDLPLPLVHQYRSWYSSKL